MEAKHKDEEFSFLTKYFRTEILDEIIKDVRRDNDSVILVDGGEGAGKTVITAICSKYVDDSFNVDRMAFSGDELLDITTALKNERYRAIQYDEAVTGLMSTDFMKEEYKNLVKLFSMARKRNLIVFLIIPNITIFSGYLIKHRVKGLIHVYKEKGIYRGRAKYYSKRSLSKLYFNVKKFGNDAYMWSKYDIDIQFTKPSVDYFKSFIDMEEYERKKDEAIERISEQKGKDRWKDRLIMLMQYCTAQGMTQVTISKEIGIKRTQVSSMLRGVE